MIKKEEEKKGNKKKKRMKFMCIYIFILMEIFIHF